MVGNSPLFWKNLTSFGRKMNNSGAEAPARGDPPGPKLSRCGGRGAGGERTPRIPAGMGMGGVEIKINK